MSTPKNKPFAIVMIAVFIAIISAAVYVIAMPSDRKPVDKDLSIMSFVISKHYVQQELNTTDATFPITNFKAKETEQNRFLVQSTVTIGKDRPTTYQAILTYSGGASSDPNNWKLESLEFLD